MIIKHSIVISLLLFSSSSFAQLSLSPVLQNNMVVQQGKEFRVWGSAPVESEVQASATWTNSIVKVKTDSNGYFELRLPVGTVQPGDFTKHALEVKSNGSTRKLSNLLIGDIWLFAGQSNMAMTMQPKEPYHSGVTDYQNEILRANYPNIRLFKTTINQPNFPVEHVGGTWQECSPSTVGDFSAVAYTMGEALFRELNIPIGLIVSAKGGVSCQAFTPRETLENDALLREKYLEPYVVDPTSVKAGAVPSTLYNGIIYPFRKLSIKGFGWYQGEDNPGDGEMYVRLNSAMVRAWRNAFEQSDLPFYYVQMTPYSWGAKNFFGGGYFYFREVQEKVMSVLENSGMVVTMDIGDPDKIHPSNKRPVGERMAGIALREVYGFGNRVCYGPRVNEVEYSEYTALISFDSSTIGLGLNTNDNESPKYFYLAGVDRVFYPAKAVIQNDKVVLSCDYVKYPVAVRYAFLTFPITNFQNANGLPAFPFRTDSWANARYAEAIK